MEWGPVLLSLVVAFVAARLLIGRFARFGGIAILAGIASAAVLLKGAYWLPLALALALAALAVVDDVRAMPMPIRLTAHLAAAAVLAGSALSPGHPLEVMLLVVALTWITKLYDAMDGVDGWAGGMALIGFGTYAVAAYLAGNPTLAALCLATAAAAAAFLAHNFPPARILLGEVGAIPLGFLAGTLGWLGWWEQLWPLWFPLLVFAPFIGDASFTLVRRLTRRERLWQAHRDHYYQRLARMDFGPRSTVAAGYGVMAACGAVALFGRTQPLIIQVYAFLSAAAGLAALAAWVDMRWAQFSRTADASGR